MSNLEKVHAGFVATFGSTPECCKWDGSNFVQTAYGREDAADYCNKWEGWKAALSLGQAGEGRDSAPQQYVIEDDGAPIYLDGIESQFTIRRASNGESMAFVAGDLAMALELQLRLNAIPAMREAPQERGWICSHPKYGTWFMPWNAVVADWKEYAAEFESTSVEPSESTVLTWWSEQCGWTEVVARGFQMQRADMAMHEKAFLKAMECDTDSPGRAGDVVDWLRPAKG